MNNGWKRIVVDGNADLHRSENSLLIIKGGETNRIPVNQINSLVIESEQITITSSLMVFLIENNIAIIFCDRKHNPCFETVPFCRNTFASERLIEQLNWNNESKLNTGCNIIKLKIQNQANLLKRLGIVSYVSFESLLDSIDETNAIEIEAIAAKEYFRLLFGYSFHRRTDNSVNSALNYGYAILLSMINRIIVSYGYNTSLGLNHHSSRNQFNFSCDIIEPFRPFVDEIVFENQMLEFDKAYKRELLSVNNVDVNYNNSIVKMETALDMFITAVIRNMNNNLSFEEMISFA